MNNFLYTFWDLNLIKLHQALGWFIFFMNYKKINIIVKTHVQEKKNLMTSTHTATSWILNLIEVGLNSGLLKLCSHFWKRKLRKQKDLNVIYIKTTAFDRYTESKPLKWYWPCSAGSASSEGVCVWGGAEMPPQAGSQAAEAAGAAWSLGGTQQKHWFNSTPIR